MPYGGIQKSTRDHLAKRAEQSGVPFDKLGIEVWTHQPDCNGSVAEDTCTCNGADNTYEITVIFGGALDEEFFVTTDYEVNIADWIAETCAEEAAKQDSESWDVIVAEPGGEGATGVVRYRVSDETWEG